MARWAQICTACGHVTNVIEWDGDAANYEPPPGHQMVEDNGGASPGGTWNGVEFVAPPAGTPVEQQTPTPTPESGPTPQAGTT